jgi:hypothetical protein
VSLPVQPHDLVVIVHPALLWAIERWWRDFSIDTPPSIQSRSVGPPCAAPLEIDRIRIDPLDASMSTVYLILAQIPGPSTKSPDLLQDRKRNMPRTPAVLLLCLPPGLLPLWCSAVSIIFCKVNFLGIIIGRRILLNNACVRR